MVGEKYFFPTITYRYIMYFFRTIKKSTAPYKVHNMGLRYIKEIMKNFLIKDFLICHRCQRHRWCSLSCECLREYSKAFETVLMGYSGTGGN